MDGGEGRTGAREGVEAEAFAALTRYIDRYGWSFNLARRLINMSCGTEYTEKQLKAIYRQNNRRPVR